MKYPEAFTEADLDALDVQTPFPNRGARQELISRLQVQVDRLVQEIKQSGGSVKGLPADSKAVGDFNACKRRAKSAAGSLG
jgi:hypothetical protein